VNADRALQHTPLLVRQVARQEVIQGAIQDCMCLIPLADMSE